MDLEVFNPFHYLSMFSQIVSPNIFDNSVSFSISEIIKRFNFKISDSNTKTNKPLFAKLYISHT